MNPNLIKAGHTYRSRAGSLDYFILWVKPPDLAYRVETGPMKGVVGRTEVEELAERVTCQVPNHRPNESPTPFRTYGPEES